MCNVFKRIAGLAVLVFVVSCGSGSYAGSSEAPQIRICVTNTTIDAMTIRVTSQSRSERLQSSRSGWIGIVAGNYGGQYITADPVGGGEAHYASLRDLGAHHTWIWDIMTFPHISLLSLKPARGMTLCD